MSLPQIPRVDREQALTDMIEALALQEAAIAGLIYAEASKIDALLKHGVPAAESLQQVESFQAAVTGVLQYAAHKGESLSRKLEMLKGMVEASKNPYQPE